MSSHHFNSKNKSTLNVYLILTLYIYIYINSPFTNVKVSIFNANRYQGSPCTFVFLELQYRGLRLKLNTTNHEK